MKVICYTSSTLRKRKNKKAKKRKAWETMLLSWKKGGPTKSVDSWFHFVWIKESRRISHISLTGRPYPHIVHNVQSPALQQTRLPYIKISRICRHSRQSVVSNPSACRMVKSRMLYVGIQESVLIAPSALSIKKAIRRIPPVFPKEHTDPSIVC